MSKAKAKGTRFETAVAGYLRVYFPACERRALRGAYDGGDLAGLPLTIECKATRAFDLAGAVREAASAAARNSQPYYAAIIKKPNYPVADAYAVMPLKVLAALLLELEGRAA